MKNPVMLAATLVLSACGGGGTSPSLDVDRAKPLAVNPATDALVQNFRSYHVTVSDGDQPPAAQLMYKREPAAIAGLYAQHGALTVLGGRPDLFAQTAQAAANRSAIIAVYLNPVLHWPGNSGACPTPSSAIDPTGNRYAGMFHCDNAVCPGAIPTWPGTGSSHGVGADVSAPNFTSKLVCVVKRIKAEHPYAKAIFLDDFTPGWSGYDVPDERSTAEQKLRAAFNALRTEKLDLLYFLNGNWNSVYWKVKADGVTPDPNGPHGVEGAIGVYEHHPISDEANAEVSYGAGSLWLTDGTRDSQGNPRGGALVITNNAAETAFWRQKSWVGWVAEQRSPYEDNAPTLSSTHVSNHPIGLSYGTRYGLWEDVDGGEVWSAGQVANRLRATRVTISEGGALQSASLYLDGKGGVSGPQKARLAIYRDNNGVPGTLLALGKEFEIWSGARGAWYTSEFTGNTISAGAYWIAESTGEVAQVSRNNGQPGTNYYGADCAGDCYPTLPSTYPPGSLGDVSLSAYISVK